MAEERAGPDPWTSGATYIKTGAVAYQNGCDTGLSQRCARFAGSGHFRWLRRACNRRRFRKDPPHVDDPGARDRRLSARCCCLAILSSAVRVQAAPSDADVIETNGLRFVIMPDTTTKLAEVDIRYDVGSREDPQGKAGLAHLVEHLMFQPRPDGPTTPPLFQTIIDLATDFNAYTNWDTTHYSNDVAVRATSTRCSRSRRCACTTRRICQPIRLLDGAEGEFEREREVVRNEIRARLERRGLHRPARRGERCIRRATRTSAWSAATTCRSRARQLKDACEFMKKYYAPERATIVIVAGNVDVDKTVDVDQEVVREDPEARGRAARRRSSRSRAAHEQQRDRGRRRAPGGVDRLGAARRDTPEGEAAQFGICGPRSAGSRAGRRSTSSRTTCSPPCSAASSRRCSSIRIELKGMDKLDEALDFAQKAAKQAYRGWDEGTLRGARGGEEPREGELHRGPRAARARAPRRSPTWCSSRRDFDFNSTEMYLFHAARQDREVRQRERRRGGQEGARLGQGGDHRRQAEREGPQGRHAREGEVRGRSADAAMTRSDRRSARGEASGQGRGASSRRSRQGARTSSSATAWTSCCCRSSRCRSPRRR